MNRRLFLHNAFHLAAGLGLFSSGVFAATNQVQTRRQVVIGGTRIKVIDVHAHCLFQEVAPIIKGTEMEGADLRGFLTLSPKRIIKINERGIDIAALSVNRF